MNNPTYYTVMADYNQWMNQKLYEICERIPDSERKEDVGAFFKSIHGTLNHLLYGDRAWMGRFTNQPFYLSEFGWNMYSDFDQLKQARQEMDHKICRWVTTLTEDWLHQPFEYTSNVDRKTKVLPTWVLVTHMFNHQTHHRGQLTTLLKQKGYDPGVTDLPWLPTLASGSYASHTI